MRIVRFAQLARLFRRFEALDGQEEVIQRLAVDPSFDQEPCGIVRIAFQLEQSCVIAV